MKSHRAIMFIAFILLTSSIAIAETKLPSIIGGNMVLQREKPIPVWGWDDTAADVTVSFNGKTMTAKVTEGKWMVELPRMKAGGPFVMTVKGSSEIKLENILIGEVWLCSGQSNMEWAVRSSDNSKEEIAAAKHPMIRHIKIPHRPSDKPESDVPSQGWQVCSPETVPGFTAVGYFFGRKLQKELNVPIGLIGSNWGGTRIEPWTPPEGFKQVPALKKDFAEKLAQFPSKSPIKNKEGKVTGQRINHQSPLALYNGMIHPLLPYSIRGAIWYQGESNNGEGMLYYEKMKALIAGWRSVWKDAEMPFYFVQLAPFTYGRGREAGLPGIWEAQTKTLDVPNTGMAVTTDISNIKDIHPRNKQDVGARLALWALAKNYGKSDLVYSGPLYKSMKAEGSKAVLSFEHVGGGLTSLDGEALSDFMIAGADKKFVEAKAEIVGDTVVVSAEGVSTPKAVRFGWSQIAEPNFGNKAKLPASPFRTDNW